MSPSVPVVTPADPAPKIPRERLEYVERLYLKGEPEVRIKAKVCERYGVTLRTARRYLARVRLRLSKLPSAQPEAVRARAEAMLLETYRLARKGVKYVTFQDGVGPDTRKETKPVPAPEVGVMANIAARLVEINGAALPQFAGRPVTGADTLKNVLLKVRAPGVSDGNVASIVAAAKDGMYQITAPGKPQSGVWRFIGDKHVGELVMENNSDAWADALKRAYLLRNDNALRDNAQQLASRHFPSWKQALEEDLISVWQEVGKR